MNKKRLTTKERAIRDEKQKIRMKIANMVARKPEIKNNCCLCGKKGTILHNFEHPYNITFLCEDCRKDPKNIEAAEVYRFDIRKEFNKNCLNIKFFDKNEVKQILKRYAQLPNSVNLSLGEYCDSLNISRYQFNLMLKMYEQTHPRSNIRSEIKRRSEFIRRKRVDEAKEEF